MPESKKEKLYTQTQIAKQLKVSQSTITRLLRKNGLKPIKTKGKSKLYSPEQIQSLNLSILHQKETHSQGYDNNDISVFLQKEISRLHDENEHLTKQYNQQLEAKDKQISQLNERLKEAHQLQLGLEQKLKMLPDVNDDTKVVNGKTIETDSSTNEQSSKPKKRGFWSRLFG